MSNPNNSFLAESEQKRGGMIREFILFLRHNKKWWLLPIVLVLLVLGLVIILGGSSLAPFIYTLF